MNKFEILLLNLTALEPHVTNGGKGILRQLRAMAQIMIDDDCVPEERVLPQRLKGRI